MLTSNDIVRYGFSGLASGILVMLVASFFHSFKFLEYFTIILASPFLLIAVEIISEFIVESVRKLTE